MQKTVKILHLSPDDKFVDMALVYFEFLKPNLNTLFVYANKKPTYVKSPATLVNKDTIFTEFDKKKYGLIVIHSLSPVWFDFIRKIAKDIPIVWVGWGYDYYDLMSNDLLLHKTEKLTHKLGIIDSCKNFLRKIKKIYLYRNKMEVVERLNYFSPVLHLEYEQIKSKLNLDKFPDYVYFNYGSLEKNFIRGYENKKVNGKNILIGNSATDTNNHLEVFDLLKDIKIEDSVKVVCPLSYGNEKYKKLIVEIGKNEFKDSFDPLVDFIDIDSYINKIISCRVVIMNHVRQQAFGNIITMLYLGAKIFLRKENPIYVFLKAQGAVIYSIQDLEDNHSLFEGDLSDMDVMKNREVLQLFISESVAIEKTQNIIDLARSI